MSPTLTSIASLPRRRARRRLSLSRLMAWVAASATDRTSASAFVFAFAMIHALLWTVILINLKAAQDVHMDVAEAFAWGQKFQLGYGKHPPLAGWLAGHRLGRLSAGDGDGVVGNGDHLADFAACRRLSPRVFRRGDARDLSDLQ